MKRHEKGFSIAFMALKLCNNIHLDYISALVAEGCINWNYDTNKTLYT